MKSVRLIISGLVQGVGFRSWLKHHADQLKLTGWGKNRPDGTVEAVIIGAETAFNGIISICREGPPGAIVRAVKIDELQNSEVFSDFTIVN